MTYPDLTVGLSYGPERNVDITDRVTTLSLALPLPIFRRNAAGIGKARTELDQARIERQAAERDTQATVNALWQRLQSLQQRTERLQRTVLPSLEENQRLSLKALQAGEIGLSQFLLVRRQVLDGRRDLLEARTDLRLVRIALEAAGGWPSELPPLAASAAEDAR
jgi:cobalt-zinc-cadmium efflux system outer membrane protein